MEQMSILVVDDDKEIADLVEIHLVSDGHKVFKANSAKEGLAILEDKDIKLVILDIMMPGIDGLNMCKKIRENSTIPIIMLSAKSSDLDKIVGLSTGADDYVIKPFNPLELTARVKSQLRRYTSLNISEVKNRDEIEIDGLLINTATHEVRVDGKEVKLTPREFDILELLARNRGIVFSMEKIYESIWKENFYESDNTIMVHIRKIREKLEENPRKPRYIKTVWGVGYKIES